MPVQNWVSPGQLPPAVARPSGGPAAGTQTPRAIVPQSVRCFPREHGPDAVPTLLARGRARCSACRRVAGSRVRLAGPHRGWQVPSWAVRSPWQVLVAFPNPTGDVLLQSAGTWHVAAVVSNCSVFLKMKDGMKSSVVTISFTPEGDMAMKLVWPL